MKLLRILKTYKIILFGVVISFSFTEKLKYDEIDISGKILFYNFNGIEYVSIKTNYKNTSKKDIILWLQDWRSIGFYDNDSLKKSCPIYFNAGSINTIVFLHDSVKGVFERNYRYLIHKSAKFQPNFYYKRIMPNEIFLVNMIITDTSVIHLLKKNYYTNALVWYSCYDYKKGKQINSKWFLNEDEITLLMNETFNDDCFAKEILIDKNNPEFSNVELPFERNLTIHRKGVIYKKN
ncbi:MAG: hypothetical protein ACEQSR_01900 [Candidatus Methylacidiphilales bacterium]